MGNVTITVSDDNSGFADTNVYKYCLSTSNVTREDCEWTDYTSGVSFNISGNDQTKYLWIWPIKDNAENINSNNLNVNTPYIVETYEFALFY